MTAAQPISYRPSSAAMVSEKPEHRLVCGKGFPRGGAGQADVGRDGFSEMVNISQHGRISLETVRLSRAELWSTLGEWGAMARRSILKVCSMDIELGYLPCIHILFWPLRLIPV